MSIERDTIERDTCAQPSSSQLQTICDLHGIKETNNKNESSKRKLIIASVLCATFALVEVVCGTLANSLAIATDAAHLLTDFFSFMISLLAIHIASRPESSRLNYGWYRAEVIGALASVLMIWLITSVLIYMAVLRIKDDDFTLDPLIMLITASIGVLVNVIIGVCLHPPHHGHTHDNSSDAEDKKCAENESVSKHGLDNSGSDTYDLDTKHDIHSPAQNDMDYNTFSDLEKDDKELIIGIKDDRKAKITHRENINVRAAFIHVLGDLIQSVGVCIASIIVWYKPQWRIVDPICTFFFSIIVLITTVRIARDALLVLMEGVPNDLNSDEIERTLLSIEDVFDLHNLRVWSLTMNKAVLSVHLVVDPKSDHQNIIATSNELMRHQFGFHECTFQIEVYVKS